MQLSENSSKKFVDTGLALILLSQIIWLFFPNKLWILTSIVLLIINMTVPVIYKPFSIFWFGMSNFMGNLMSKLLLTVIFYLIIFPVGIFQKLKSKGNININQWKKSKKSVFVSRDKTFTYDDIKTPY